MKSRWIRLTGITALLTVVFAACAGNAKASDRMAADSLEAAGSVSEWTDSTQTQEGTEKISGAADTAGKTSVQASETADTLVQASETADTSVQASETADTALTESETEEDGGQETADTEAEAALTKEGDSALPEIEGQSVSESGAEESQEGTGSSAELSSGRLIVIDAGHQQQGNSDKEPIGPGASETKAKVAGGTSGCVSGLHEYELTLMVSEKLQNELQSRGYQVIMVRTSHDVNISNAERAQVANSANADAFIRIHANGSENSSANGAMTICQTPQNPYNGALYAQSQSLSANVLEGLTAETGCKKQYVWETDTMSGINWCSVPATIVEMGYMTNPDEDARMATEEYQTKLAVGIANGIDSYFAN